MNPTVDSYCCVYRQIVQQKGDGNIQASRGVKERILVNEKTFRSQCSKEAIAACPKTK